MSKLKTKKTIAKRFRITKRGKVIKRSTGQAHFNARASGEKNMRKRGDKVMRKGHDTTIKQLIVS